MGIEHDLLSRMFKDDLEMAERLLAIRDYAMAAESLAHAIEKIHQIAALDCASVPSVPVPIIDLL